MRFENLLNIGYRIDIPITMYSIQYTSIDRISSGNLLKSVIFCNDFVTDLKIKAERRKKEDKMIIEMRQM